MHVFKQKRAKGNRTWTSAFWKGRYRLNGDEKWTTVPLHVRQKDVAERKLSEIVQREERRRHGLLNDEVEVSAAAKGLADHLLDFERDLQTRGRSSEYIRKVVPRCRRIANGCGWQKLGQVTADSFIGWRSSQTWAPRTSNHHLEAFRCFLEWMRGCGRIKTNPLQHVQKVETRGRQKVVRRAYTRDELGRLLAIAGPRSPIYLGAALTGLRFKELKRLRCCDLQLGGAEPTVRLPASIQKTPEYKSLPLAQSVADAWAPLAAGRPVTARLFGRGMPSHHTLTADLEKAGIPKRDERGRQVDFHSFRMTFTTFLQQAGVDRRLVMEVARHKDSRLTDLVYTDAERLDLRGAINSLPALEARTQKSTHATVPEGHSVSSCGTTDAEEPASESVTKPLKSRGLARAGTVRHDAVKNGAGGNRTPVPRQSARRFYACVRWIDLEPGSCRRQHFPGSSPRSFLIGAPEGVAHRPA
jgi:integrase